jgi:hypothetical protein
MFSVPTAADLLVVSFAAFMQTRTAILVEKSSPATLLTKILAFRDCTARHVALMPVQGQTQFNCHHMAMGAPPSLALWRYKELTRAQLSGLQQKPTRIVQSKSKVSWSLLFVVLEGIFLTRRLMRAC